MSRAQRLLAQLDHHVPASPREHASLHRMRALVRWLPHPFDEHADATHVTASAIVVDGDGRVVLHRHRRLGIWLQPGGHVAPGEAPEDAAVREVREETGLEAALEGGPVTPLHIDVHEGGRGHLHLDVRYLLTAPAGSSPRPAAGESQEVAWLPYDEATRRGDDSLRDAVAAARRRLADAGDGITRG